MTAIRSLFIVAACVAIPAGTSAGVIYSNDFELHTNGFIFGHRTWLPIDENGTVSNGQGFGPTGSVFLGPLSSNSVFLPLSGLVAGTEYDIAFDLFIGASMDGNHIFNGPDLWSLTTSTGETLISTSFSNQPDRTSNPPHIRTQQSYSDTSFTAFGDFAAFTGADVVQANQQSQFNVYSIYYFGHGAGNPILSFKATGTTAVLTFGGFGLQSVSDEFWAIDNVVVSTSYVEPPPNDPEPTDPDPAGTVAPEPATLALLSFGGIGLLVGTWRRRPKALSA